MIYKSKRVLLRLRNMGQFYAAGGVVPGQVKDLYLSGRKGDKVFVGIL